MFSLQSYAVLSSVTNPYETKVDTILDNTAFVSACVVGFNFPEIERFDVIGVVPNNPNPPLSCVVPP